MDSFNYIEKKNCNYVNLKYFKSNVNYDFDFDYIF